MNEHRAAAAVDVEAALRQIVGFYQTGRYEEMECATRQLTVQRPSDSVAWHLLGVALMMRGQTREALTPLRRALSIRPGFAEAYSNLGNALRDLGEFEEATASYRRALEIKPDLAEVHGNLGNVLKDLGRHDEAISSYQRALEIKPDFAEAYFNLGNTYIALGKLNEAADSYRRAIEFRPDHAKAYYNLGAALADLGSLEQAVASYRRAVQIEPDFVDGWCKLGCALGELGTFDEAIDCLHRAIDLPGNPAEAHVLLGTIYDRQGNYSEAIASFHRALVISPDLADAHAYLGCALGNIGRAEEGIASYRRALEIKPDFAKAHSNLIFALDLAAGESVATLQQERRRWDSIHAAPLAAMHRPHGNRPDPERRLRIGYVSADFRTHSAAYVFGAMLLKFDPACFDVFAYSNTTTEDSYTRVFQQGVTCWRKIVGQTDEAVADVIRQDEIDILVDLSGHSAGDRLLVFARKPAPIQVTAWGYATSTGMQAMDVFFADPVVVPPEEKHFYTEEIRYLPSVVGSYFPDAFPAVNPLPALAAEGITFGSFNRLTKVSDEAYQVWAQILLAIPGSRMVLKAGELDNAGVKARVTQHFTRAGVDPARIALLGKSTWHDHVAAFGQVDIALDPFPHGGGVTTLEGLMMGVPVVTLRWPTIVGRLSASVLTTLGLTDWIAETPEQYIEITQQKAQNLTALADFRQQLRPLFTSSIIGDSDAYVRSVEQEYRKIWQQWCRKSAVSV